jgi:molecular chaperone DnaK
VSTESASGTSIPRVSAIGIDLGTTHSLVAYLDGETPRLIPGTAGELLTPSIVARRLDGVMVVGLEAKAILAQHPERALANFKRAMGTSEELVLAGEKFRAEELSALVLRKLRSDAERVLGGRIEEAVVTVPAYFTDAQREATKVAGELAGLRVERIINEPTAAALAYGLANLEAEDHVLVYDLGGGTFDVSVLEMFSGLLDVKASTGNNRLGGIDFDAALAELVIKRAGKPGLTAAERAALVRQCEVAKRALSDTESTEVLLRYTPGDTAVSCEARIVVNRADFQAATRSLVEATLVSVDQALADAKLTKTKLGPIVLVGGSSRMPVVRAALTAHFNKPLHDGVHPDHAIALGAAVQVGLKLGGISAQTGIMITDVAPFTLGVEVSHQAGNHLVHGMFSSIITRNSTVPISRTERVTTVGDGQRSVRVRVFQGESRYTKNNTFLDEFVLDGVPPAPAGKEPVAITFTYDINGILHVSAEIVSTGKKAELTVERKTRDRMTGAELEAARARLSKIAVDGQSSYPTAMPVASTGTASSLAAAHAPAPGAAAAFVAGADGSDLRASLLALAAAAEQRRPGLPPDAHARLDALVARTRVAVAQATGPELQDLDVEFTDFLFRYC